jgi:hypothetical protein
LPKNTIVKYMARKEVELWKKMTEGFYPVD